eukprot:755127-Amphidinium_carterae.1
MLGWTRIVVLERPAQATLPMRVGQLLPTFSKVKDHCGLCRALVVTGLKVLPEAAPVLVPFFFASSYVHDAKPTWQLFDSSLACSHHHSTSYIIRQPRWTHRLS